MRLLVGSALWLSSNFATSRCPSPDASQSGDTPVGERDDKDSSRNEEIGDEGVRMQVRVWERQRTNIIDIVVAEHKQMQTGEQCVN